MSNYSDVVKQVHDLQKINGMNSNLSFVSIYKDGIYKVACFDTSNTTKFTFKGGHAEIAKRVY